MRARATLILAACFRPYQGGLPAVPEEPGPAPAERAERAGPEGKAEGDPEWEPETDEELAEPPRERAPRTITLRVLADEQARLDGEWRSKTKAALAQVHAIYQPLQIAFEAIDTGLWETPPGEGLDALVDRLEQQPKGQAEVVIGYVGGEAAIPDSSIDEVGRARYPGDVAVVRFGPVGRTARVLAHELGHLLGAVHIEQHDSIMASRLGAGGARIDAYNLAIIDANRDRLFQRADPPLTREQADWALRAVERVLRDDRHNRDADDMRTLLREYKIHLRSFERERGGEDSRRQAESLVRRARALLHEDKRGRALAHFREALRADPKVPGAHLGLGRDLFDRGEPDRAARELFAETRNDPRSAEAWYLLGRCHEKLGRRDQAREAWRTALGVEPGHEGARAALAALDAAPPP